MKFKEFPYWLKGGLIGLGIGLILVAITFLCTPFFSGMGARLTCWIPVLLVMMVFPWSEKGSLILFVYPLFYFVIGTLIGLIVGAIKRKGK